MASRRRKALVGGGEGSGPDHLDLSRPNTVNPGPSSPDSIAFFDSKHARGPSGESHRMSGQARPVEKATNAGHLAQDTSSKIALLVDAITKKQTSAILRWTGRGKPETDVIKFLEY